MRAGYEKHGTLWGQIVKDPIFQEQKRRSTDLRDRFRNAFPDLYEAAGYKPRPMSKKKRMADPVPPLRAVADDQIPSSFVGPSRQRENTNEGLFRRGIKTVSEILTNSDDETSGDEMDCDVLDVRPSGTGKRRASQPLPMHFRDVVIEDGSQSIGPPSSIAASAPPQPSQPPAPAPDIAQSPPQVSDLTDSSQQSQTWRPTPAWVGQWQGTNPTSSHVSNSETFMDNFPLRPQHMIGKSAWGGQDWFSANPPLDQPMLLGLSNNGSIYGGGGLAPGMQSSPFSLNTLGRGVFNRSHQPQQHFDNGVGGSELELSGIQAPPVPFTHGKQHVSPALYLCPVNNPFVPKLIVLLPQQRVKIGRQTNAKTVPTERNGYFDSKALSRQHAEVWEQDGTVISNFLVPQVHEDSFVSRFTSRM